jgi:predicted ATPase/transcriptional regulator with XRE-family HTH domain
MPQPSTSFGHTLRILRRRARLTQAELGIAVGYSDAQICRLETGRRPPDLSTLVALFLPALGLAADDSAAQDLLAQAAQARDEYDRVSTPHPATTLAIALTPDLSAPSSTTNPAMAALPSIPHPADPLIGRQHEQQQIYTLLAGHARLVTLIGPAGIGKTRLALHLAHQLASQYRDGVRFVDLSAATDSTQLTLTLIQAFDLEVSDDPEQALHSFVATRQMLVVLDNLEQVERAAPLLGRLLAAAPGLVLLTTSRVALRLAAEHTLVLSPLALPDLANLPPPDRLAEVESVALLVRRLRIHTPSLAVSAANALALAAICVRVDGIPLAIELVAAHGRLFTPQELLGEVAQHFLHMRRRGRDIPSRHTTLIAAIQWSYDQLPIPAQTLFARLSSYANGWTLAAALACADLEDLGRAALIEQLELLLDHSLIQQQQQHDQTRFSMLAMVRAFAADQLARRGEEQIMQQQLLRYYTDLATAATQAIGAGSQQRLWIQRIEAEYDNIVAGLRWALANHASEQGLKLAAQVGRFWYSRGYLREGRRWLETFLTLTSNAAIARSHAYAIALDAAGLIAWRQGDYRQAERWYNSALVLFEHYQDHDAIGRVRMRSGILLSDMDNLDRAAEQYQISLAIYRNLGDQQRIASVLHNLGNLACQQNQIDLALQYYHECLPIYEQRDDTSGIALLSLGLGVIARDQGNLEQAAATFQRSYELAMEIRDSWNAANALLNMGEIASDQQFFHQARQYLNQAVQMIEQIGDQQLLAQVLTRLGTLDLAEHQPAAALQHFRQALMLAQAIEFRGGVGAALEGVAQCILEQSPLPALRLLAAADSIRQSINLPIPLAEQELYAQLLAHARGLVGPTWQGIWHEGHALSPNQATALALTQHTMA